MSYEMGGKKASGDALDGNSNRMVLIVHSLPSRIPGVAFPTPKTLPVDANAPDNLKQLPREDARLGIRPPHPLQLILPQDGTNDPRPPAPPAGPRPPIFIHRLPLRRLAIPAHGQPDIRLWARNRRLGERALRRRASGGHEVGDLQRRVVRPGRSGGRFSRRPWGLARVARAGTGRRSGLRRREGRQGRVLVARDQPGRRGRADGARGEGGARLPAARGAAHQRGQQAAVLEAQGRREGGSVAGGRGDEARGRGRGGRRGVRCFGAAGVPVFRGVASAEEVEEGA